MVTSERYWNTWHPQSCSRMDHIATGFCIVPGAFSEAESSYSQFPFDENMRLYEHEAAGRYCRLKGTHAHAEFEIEYLKADPWTVLLRMTNVKEPLEWGIRYHMLVSLGFENENGEIYVDRDNRITGAYENYRIAAAFCGEPPYDVLLAENSHAVGDVMADKGYKTTVSPKEKEPGWATCRFVLEQSPQICLAVSIAHDEETADTNARKALKLFACWEKQKELALKEYPTGTDEKHSGMTEAVSEVMAWNAMYSKELDRTYNSIAKTWNKNFGGWYLFFSDTCYQTMFTALTGDFEMAAENLEYALWASTPDGNFAGMLSPWQKWVDRTQPPVLAFCLWMYYLVSQDLSSLKKAYPILRREQEWFLSRRTDGSNHLIRLGTTRTGDGSFVGTKLAAKDETAMDNSPMYDKARFDRETGLLELYDVGMSSQLALDIECTSFIAVALGKTEEADALLKLADTMKREMNELLWNEEEKIYSNRLLDGSYGLTSPTSFYPLAAGAADERRLEESIKHIFNEEEFFTECPLIAINAKDPSARENKYWRGRTWAPQSFWTYIGLRRYGKEEEAFKLADHAVKYFDKHWKENRRSYENFNPYTGCGTDTVDSQPFYSWTALLPLIWTMEQFGVTPWDGFYFGTVHGMAFTQKNRRYKGKLYDVCCDGQITTLRQDGNTIFSSDIPGRFRHFEYTEHYCSVTVTSKGNGIVEFPKIKPKLVLANGKEVSADARISVGEGKTTIAMFL